MASRMQEHDISLYEEFRHRNIDDEPEEENENEYD